MQDALNAKLKFDSVGESGLNTTEKEALKTFFPSALNKTEQVKSENLLDIRV
ncbi:hypothetical protein [Campylobacter gastrosuis]|uniref:Uncharacterized protein n=1 Tax=Campylobacter gastrosuis TaxID=2974576 RepID=A0ABT7HNC3_9BACT|nr:hypothetical protein [Campylobacter gastrosuis]MDL0087934.1 hypothetical protein [Campylobacter gastrosuis]